jgi:hypothetical protein
MKAGVLDSLRAREYEYSALVEYKALGSAERGMYR